MRTAWRIINRILDDLGSVLFVAFTIIAFIQVVFRFVLHYPTPWSEETARFLLVIMTFVGAALATRDESHLVAMDLFAKAPRALRLGIGVLIRGGILFFAALMFIGSLEIIEVAGEETATSFVWLKMAHVYSVLPLSFGLMCIYTVRNIIRQFARS
jgi:TRAP-type C4-dicarboxylate transport system permease small subunit